MNKNRAKIILKKIIESNGNCSKMKGQCDVCPLYNYYNPPVKCECKEGDGDDQTLYKAKTLVNILSYKDLDEIEELLDD